MRRSLFFTMRPEGRNFSIVARHGVNVDSLTTGIEDVR